MQDRTHLLTEQRLAESMALDTMSVSQIVDLMAAQDAVAVAAVAAERDALVRAVDLIVEALRDGGILCYVGAGTSGRLGVLDAAECPPTFRTHPDMVQAIIAGGAAAVFASQEGAEDNLAAGAAAIDAKNITAADVVVGIAAGGTTPFVHGALNRARELRAGTIFLTCVQALHDEPLVDVTIRPLTGPEVVTGSTRLKAGTATKLVLNTLTTATMVRLGKVYQNLMVDLRATNEKLWDRGARIIAMVTGLNRESATDLLTRADGHVKLALVMHQLGLTAESAQATLNEFGGNLRAALG